MAIFIKQRVISVLESFSSIERKDAENGSIAGVTSPYSANHKQGVSLALMNAEDQSRALASSITTLYNSHRIKDGIHLDSAQYLEDFNRFSILVFQSMKINNVLSGDEIILKKLADILSYAYARANKGKFRVYPDFDSAKRVAMLIFDRAQSLGLTFFTADLSDLIQKVLMSVVYKPSEESKQKKSKDTAPDVKPLRPTEPNNKDLPPVP